MVIVIYRQSKKMLKPQWTTQKFMFRNQLFCKDIFRFLKAHIYFLSKQKMIRQSMESQPQN
jgi:hypothetical protein